MVVGYGPGGSASFYAQALAHRMGRFLAGTPSLVVQHMPGAGGLLAANNLFNAAARDGARHHGPHDGDRAAHRLLERIYATPKIERVKAVTE
jgi:tripartite-type tricarboxylate transporter receptor subunit TctC